MVCSVENRDCMLHLSEHCPGRRAVQDYLTNLCTALDFSFEDSLEYKQWLHTDRATLTITTPIEEFIPIVVDSFGNLLCQHHFIGKAPSRYSSKLKETLGPTKQLLYSILLRTSVLFYCSGCCSGFPREQVTGNTTALCHLL